MMLRLWHSKQDQTKHRLHHPGNFTQGMILLSYCNDITTIKDTQVHPQYSQRWCSILKKDLLFQ